MTNPAVLLLLLLGLTAAVVDVRATRVAALEDEAKLAAFEEWYAARNPGVMEQAGLRLRRPSDGDDVLFAAPSTDDADADADAGGAEGGSGGRPQVPPSVGPGAVPQGRPGLVSTKGVAVDAPVFVAPADSMITLHTVEESPVGQVLYKINQRWGFGLAYDPVFYETLSLFVLYEKFFRDEERDGPSEWKPYLDLLPEPHELDDILFWSTAELQLLEGSPMRTRALDRRTEVRDNFHWLQQNVFRAYEDLFGTEGPTERQYRWSVAIVRSRNLQTIQYGEMIPALCPLFSLARYTHTGSVDEEPAIAFPEETEELTLFARGRAVPPGGEVLVPTAKGNAQQIEYYGFAFPGNMDEVVHVDVELRVSDPLANEKSILFKQANAEDGELRIEMRGVTQALYQAAKIATIAQNEITSDMLVGGFPEYPISDRSEYAVAEYFVSLCRNVYKNIVSSRAEDQALLDRTEDNRPPGRDPSETDRGFDHITRDEAAAEKKLKQQQQQQQETAAAEEGKKAGEGAEEEAAADSKPKRRPTEFEHAYHWPLTDRERMAVLLRSGERNVVSAVGANYFRAAQERGKRFLAQSGGDDEGSHSHTEL